jgi:DNA-binding Lrp family transcriptional regulator
MNNNIKAETSKESLMNSVHDGSKRHAESKLHAAVRIRSAFITRNEKGEDEALTWNQIRERSGLSKGALSKYLTQLIEEGCVKGEIRVVDHRQVTFYQWVPGKGTAVSYVDEEIHECFRFYVPRDKAGEILVRQGIKIRSGKTTKGKEKEVFRGHGPITKLKKKMKESRGRR